MNLSELNRCFWYFVPFRDLLEHYELNCKTVALCWNVTCNILIENVRSLGERLEVDTNVLYSFNKCRLHPPYCHSTSDFDQ